MFRPGPTRMGRTPPLQIVTSWSSWPLHTAPNRYPRHYPSQPDPTGNTLDDPVNKHSGAITLWSSLNLTSIMSIIMATWISDSALHLPPSLRLMSLVMSLTRIGFEIVSTFSEPFGISWRFDLLPGLLDLPGSRKIVLVYPLPGR